MRQGNRNLAYDFSNSEKEILEALYDRLDLKLVTRYVEDKDARLSVLQNKQNGTGENITATITLDELLEMQREAAQVVIPPELNEIMDKVLCELRSKNVPVSDRTYFNFYQMVRAMAWLRGAATAAPQDMMTLRHCLWQVPEERTVVRETLERYCVSPVFELIKEVGQLGRDALESCLNATEIQNTKRMRKYRGELTRVYEGFLKVQQKAETDEERAQASELRTELEAMSSQAHTACGFSYVPMEEIYTLQNVA